MTDKSHRKALLLSLAVCLSAPATVTASAAQAGDAAKAAAAEPAPAAGSTKAADAATPAPAAATAGADSRSKEKEQEQEQEMEKRGSNRSGAVEHKQPQDRMSDVQRRHADEGYYGRGGDQQSDNQVRHTDEGYYSEVKPYVPAPLEARPVAPPLTTPIQVGPPPLIIPAVGTGAPGGRKFDDDTGGTGSIIATRHAKQAQELLQSGHFDLAKSHFRESLATSPNQVDLYPGYWECCAKSNDWGEGRRALEKLFELDATKRKDYCWAYGDTWYQLKNYEKAVPVLKEALKYGVHEEDIHNDLLKIALNERSLTDIPAEYTAIIKVNPSDVKTQLDFANWLEVQGRHTDAISHYRAAASLTPADGSLAARLAYMLMYYSKDYRDAISYYHKAIAADPVNAARYQENIRYAEAQEQAKAASSAPAKKREQQ